LPDDWTLVASNEVAPGRASLPDDWFMQPGNEDTTWVQVNKGKDRKVLLAEHRASAKGRQIHVAPGTLGVAATVNAEVQATPLSVSDLKRLRAKEAVTGLGFIGLVLALAGFAMQGFLNFNQHYAVLNANDLTIGLMSAFSPLDQILGAILIFIKTTVFGSLPGA
jgi:hypothetical protein